MEKKTSSAPLMPASYMLINKTTVALISVL